MTTNTYLITRRGFPAEVVRLRDVGFGLVINRNPNHAQQLEKLLCTRFTAQIDGARIWAVVAHDWPASPITYLPSARDEYSRWLGPVLISPAGNVGITPSLTPQIGALETAIRALVPAALYASQFNDLLAMFTASKVRNG